MNDGGAAGAAALAAPASVCNVVDDEPLTAPTPQPSLKRPGLSHYLGAPGRLALL